MLKLTETISFYRLKQVVTTRQIWLTMVDREMHQCKLVWIVWIEFIILVYNGIIPYIDIYIYIHPDLGTQKIFKDISIIFCASSEIDGAHLNRKISTLHRVIAALPVSSSYPTRLLMLQGFRAFRVILDHVDFYPPLEPWKKVSWLFRGFCWGLKN